MKKTLCAAVLVLLLGGGRSAMADVLGFNLGSSFGFGYADGRYGTSQDTNVVLGLTTFSAKNGNLEFDIGVPYMRIAGRGLVVFDAAGNPILINRRSTAPADVRTGFGDLNFGATYAIPTEILGGFDVKLTGRLKLPTASARKRLSTGETDFSMSVDVSHAYGRWEPFVEAGYLVSGQPASFSLKDTLSVSAGTSYELTDSLIAIASYDFDSASSPLLASSQELFASLGWLVNDQITLTGYATKGMSSGSPNVGAGLIVTYGFN